jgi:cell division septation protein DedD
MKSTILTIAKFTRQAQFVIFSAAFAVTLILFAAQADSAYAQEGSSTPLILVPTQERIPQADWIINPEYIIPPIPSPPSPPVERRDTSPPPAPSPAVRNPAPFKAPLISRLERGKWYVQIGAYASAAHVEDAIKRAGTSSPLVVQNVGTDAKPMFRVLLGPFSQNESKTVLKRFRDKGYDAFLRSGN